LPFCATVRPNSEITTMVVSAYAGPRLRASADIPCANGEQTRELAAHAALIGVGVPSADRRESQLYSWVPPHEPPQAHRVARKSIRGGRSVVRSHHFRIGLFNSSANVGPRCNIVREHGSHAGVAAVYRFERSADARPIEHGWSYSGSARGYCGDPVAAFEYSRQQSADAHRLRRR
jgi:hypothetical protein